MPSKIMMGVGALQYTWASPYAFDTASIPKAAAQQLKLAGSQQIKVLLWLACAGQGRFDAAECSAACGISPAVCEECLHYWVQAGLVTAQGSPVKAAPVTVTPKADVPEQSTTTPAPLVSGMPQVGGRPTREEALRVKTGDSSFAMLLDTAASKLGKMLSSQDLSTFLYLYRELSLPPEVILMAIGYAVQNGKGKMAYIEKTLLGWHEDGINTFEAAEAHVRRLEQCKQAWDTLCEWQEITVARPTLAQKEAVCRWMFEWKLEREVIETALAVTVEKTGKLQIAYADRLAEQLHACGVTTAEQARAELTAEKPKSKTKTSRARMKTAEDRAPSYDIAEYEKMVRRHRPTPPKED